MTIGGGNTITNEVITKYKADVVHHRDQLKSLATTEKRFADEAVASAKARSAAWKKFGADAAVAIGTIGAAIAVAKVGFDHYRESSKLAAASSSIDMDRISKAAGGLKSNMELMRLSAAAANGAWKMSTDSLEIVVEGMRALEKQGFDTVDITNKITDVLKKGKLEGLDDFGISLKSTGDRTKDMTAFLKAMHDEVKEVGGNFDMAGDGVERNAIRMENALDRVKSAIGRATTAMLDYAEAAGRGLAIAIKGPSGEYAENLDNIARRDRAIDEIRFRNRRGGQLADRAWAEQVYYQEQGLRSQLRTGKLDHLGPSALTFSRDQKRFDLISEGEALRAAYDAAIARSVIDQLEKAVFNPFTATGAGKSGRGRPPPSAGRGTARSGPDYGDAWAMLDEAIAATSGRTTGAWEGTAELEYLRAPSRNGEVYAAQSAFGTGDGTPFASGPDAYRQQEAAKTSRLEKIFGPLSDFDAYATAFGALTDAIGASFGAWIDGSKNAAAAFGAVLKEAGKAAAVTMLIDAIKHTAWGTVSAFSGGLPTGNPLMTAPQHFAAAAKYGAAALGIGALTKAGTMAFGGGGGGGAGAYAAAGIGTGVTAPSQQGVSFTVVQGDAFASDSPRYVARRTRRNLDNARMYADYEAPV